MSEWDGRGLPPAAQARIARASGDGVRTSLLSAPAAAALGGLGFDPVGEVMGCVVEHIGWGGVGCGLYYGGMGGVSYGYSRTQLSGQGGYAGYAPYVNALYYGYEQSLHRMLLEAQALGADGVVGVRWTQQSLDETGNREFVAMGTAVRARSASRPARIFSTDLDGPDVAKLLHGGWAPAALVVGISVGVRHDDYYTRMQARPWSNSNVEVDGYTELVTHTRADAREQFAVRVARSGADAAIVSDMTLHVSEVEPSDGHRDHIAIATMTGTGVAEFQRGDHTRTDTLTVIPMRTLSSRSSP
jgi:uncharacterized protein YbjQ (UPF0145 family)